MSVISLCGIYLTGAFLRKYDAPWFKASKCWLWLILYLGIGFVMVAIAAIALRIGLKASPYGYLNPLIIIEAICLFMFFERINIKQLLWVDWIAASAFAVYLFHTSAIFSSGHQLVAKAIEYNFGFSFVIGLLFMACVFAISVVVDKLRLLIFKSLIAKDLKP